MELRLAQLLEILLVDKMTADAATGCSNRLDWQVAQYMTEGVLSQYLDAETKLAPASLEVQRSLYLDINALHQ